MPVRLKHGDVFLSRERNESIGSGVVAALICRFKKTFRSSRYGPSTWNVDDDVHLGRYGRPVTLGGDVFEFTDGCQDPLFDCEKWSAAMCAARQKIAQGGASWAIADLLFARLAEPWVRRRQISFLAAAGRGPHQHGFVGGVEARGPQRAPDRGPRESPMLAFVG